MGIAMTSNRSGLAAVLLPALLFLAATPAAAQAPIMQEAPQQQPQANPVCSRLEAQLQAFDSSGPDQMRAEQIRKYEAAAAQQQGQLDRLGAQAKRAGCQGTNFFSIFGGQPAACTQINNQMKQMKGNLDRIEGDLARLQGSDPAPEREGQRRALIGALAQNDCGPQYRQAAAQPPQQRGGLFESLFGPGTVVSGAPGEFSQGAGYRTVCVRTCDGYYYPISYSTSPSKFPEDERTCQASCPTAEVMLFAHRNPGEDINQAISTTGQPYTALPNAFKYRQAFDNACSCKRSGESWSNALKGIQDPTAAPGDIVVTEDRAKQLSQPRVDAQGKPIKLEIPPRPAKPGAKPAQPAAPAAEADTAAAGEPATVKPDPNRTVRQVGPTFIAR